MPPPPLSIYPLSPPLPHSRAPPDPASLDPAPLRHLASARRCALPPHHFPSPLSPSLRSARTRSHRRQPPRSTTATDAPASICRSHQLRPAPLRRLRQRARAGRLSFERGKDVFDLESPSFSPSSSASASLPRACLCIPTGRCEPPLLLSPFASLPAPVRCPGRRAQRAPVPSTLLTVAVATDAGHPSFPHWYLYTRGTAAVR